MEPTVNEYITAAKIVAGCGADRLPMVRRILEQAGIDLGDFPDDAIHPSYAKTQDVLGEILQTYKAHFDGTNDVEQWGEVNRSGLLVININDLRALLDAHGIRWDDVKKPLMLEGILIPDKYGKYTQIARYHGQMERCAVIDPTKIKNETEDKANV